MHRNGVTADLTSFEVHLLDFCVSERPLISLNIGNIRKRFVSIDLESLAPGSPSDSDQLIRNALYNDHMKYGKFRILSYGDLDIKKH